MQHIKPSSKGDPLCPLGFHPQVRWPTRCKRCFRDYKEHGGSRNKDEDRELKRRILAVSSPSLTNWSTKNSDVDNGSLVGKRSWISSSNLSVDNHCPMKFDKNDSSSSCTSSWTSTPNLAQLNDANLNGETVSVTLPRRRPSSGPTSSTDDDYRRTSYSVRRRTNSSLSSKLTAERKVDDYSRESTTEVSKLRERINNLTETCENLSNERKGLLSRIQQLEAENKSGKFVSVADEITSLRARLQAAESRSEKLMDENEEMKRELQDREEEIQEMQDNFRDSEVDEYSSLRKELEQTGKNCRILSFKLRKSERKAELLEAEKLEFELKSKEAVQKLQKELDEMNEKMRLHKGEDARKRAPMLGNIPKVSSGEKVSRASLTRGGSQEDPAQLLRDLQDSIEREADLREQLRYAEEEAQNLRKNVTRIEDDNESLMLQLKRMATKAKGNRSSPCHSTINDSTLVEKDEGISDDDDPAELKVLLDLSEQESGVLRKKVEQLEQNCDIFKRKASDLQEKLLTKDNKVLGETKSSTLLKTMEAELKDIKTKLLEKESECSRLKAEINSSNEKNKQYSRSISDDKDRTNVEKQLQMVEQEASVLRSRIGLLESENEKLSAENKQLSILKSSRKSPQTKTNSKSKTSFLEKQLKMKIKGSEPETVEGNKQMKKDSTAENLPVQLPENTSEPQNSSLIIEKELSKALGEIESLNAKLKLLEKEKLEGEQTMQTLRTEILRLKDETEKMQINFEIERGANNQHKEEQRKQLLKKDAELKLLNKRLNSINENRFDELKRDFDAKVDDFKSKLRSKQKEYQELTNKYEQLEEEYVKLKCQSNLQKEQLQSQIGCLQKELTIVQNELRTLRETYNCRQDEWIKEKLRFEDRIKDFEAYKSIDENHKLELSRVKLALEVKESESEHQQKNNAALLDQVEHMRRENDELIKKLDDFEKVIKIQHNMVAESTSLDTQLRDLKNQLYNEREGRKVEVAALKIRYENHVAAISEELKDFQSQVVKLKHERDTYKHCLEESPTHSDVKSSNDSNTTSNPDDHEELRSQVLTLKQQVDCMEDELSEAQIENSRLKTELLSERSAWEVQFSEMTSKINHMEEERLLRSGRTKTAGLKTRMELSWHKEREEQLRLLQETSTLARDLRQTLFEVERERDKERLEMKRRIDQMKKNSSEEHEEAKKKLHELQCDLLELRDAHAKLRTTNEKLRREKENSFRQNLRFGTNEINSSKVHCILDIIYDLAKQTSSPDKGLPPVPPKKHVFRESSFDLKSVSRESSLTKEDPPHLLQKLFDLAHQIRESSYHSNREAARKAFVSKRPASTESDNTIETNKTLQRRGSLYRKCISLEQTASPYEIYEPHIWRGDDDTEGSIISSAASVQSTEESYAPKFPRKYDPTFDSRLSGGSTHSEMLLSTLERKKKKGFLGKLKKLTKSSRSVDDGAEVLPSISHRQVPPGSNSRISSNIIPCQDTVAKKDLKTRISGIFKLSDSRCNRYSTSNQTEDSLINPYKQFCEANNGVSHKVNDYFVLGVENESGVCPFDPLYHHSQDKNLCSFARKVWTDLIRFIIMVFPVFLKLTVITFLRAKLYREEQYHPTEKLINTNRIRVERQCLEKYHRKNNRLLQKRQTPISGCQLHYFHIPGRGTQTEEKKREKEFNWGTFPIS